MPTDHPGEQESARLRELRGQRQTSESITQGTMPRLDIYGTQPLSPTLSMQGFSMAGIEDIEQRSTRPEKAVKPPVSTLIKPAFSLATRDNVWRQSTQPLKVVEMPAPAELSPLEHTPFTPDQVAIAMPTMQARPMPVTPGAMPLVNVPPVLMPPMPAMPAPVTPQMQREGISVVFINWAYRIWLICATALLVCLLLWLQALLDHVHVHPSTLRTIVQWAELTWLTPIPLAIILWLGWFFFAEASRPDPLHVSAPILSSARRGVLAYVPPRPARLVFRFVTRGDNVAILRDSVLAVQQAFARYQQAAGPYGIEIISECPISLNLGPDSRISIYVVPPAYVTQHRSRFKARALTYLQEQVYPREEDWYIYLDEESLVNEHMLAGVYRFIWRSIEAERRAQQRGKQSHPAGLIGQGAILYQGGNWFFRGADALRTADDLGRFRLQYALGVPMFGVHGSYIVIRGIHDKQLSFDVGTSNSITEDAAWALRAWSRGFRFAWVRGYLHEQPPQKAHDFVRQRSRWLSGIRAVLGDRQTPLPYRLCLGIFTILWQFAFLPFLVAVVALFIHASPFYWLRLPADFAWATFTLAYLQGIDIQSRYPHPFLKKGAFEIQWKRAVSWLLVLCSIWYALLEAVGVLYSFKPKQGFFVIQKPSLAAEKEKVKRTRPQQ